MQIENTFDTLIYWKMRNLYDIHSFIGSYFICEHISLEEKPLFTTSVYDCFLIERDILQLSNSHLKQVTDDK
jgi:hypothetical protein